MTVAWTRSYKNNKCSSSSTEQILLASNRTIESQSFLARLPDIRGLLNSIVARSWKRNWFFPGSRRKNIFHFCERGFEGKVELNVIWLKTKSCHLNLVVWSARGCRVMVVQARIPHNRPDKMKSGLAWFYRGKRWNEFFDMLVTASTIMSRPSNTKILSIIVSFFALQ